MNLIWMPHPAGCGGQQAFTEFPNGYSVSAIRGESPFLPYGGYEIAVYGPDGTRVDGIVPGTFDGVKGVSGLGEVEEILQQVSRLPRKKAEA